MKSIYFIAANKQEGCGHRHQTLKVAKACAARLSDHVRRWGLNGGPFYVYRMTHGVRVS